LSEIQEFFRQNGYWLAKDLIARPLIARYLAEATRVCRDHAGTLGDYNNNPIPGGAAFARLPESEILSRVLAIHFPHKLSPLFREALAHPGIVGILGQVIGPNVKCAQSMLFVKQAGKPGQAWHQDEYFIPTRDRSLCGVWIALDPATRDNGCLRVLPGSHRPGVIYPTRPHGSDEYDGAPEAYGYPEDPASEVVVEMAPGDVLFFNGYLLHSSRANRAPAGTYRRALVHHYLSAESYLPWDLGGMIPHTEDNRDIVMVRGDDPYAWKGIENNNRPYLRVETWL